MQKMKRFGEKLLHLRTSHNLSVRKLSKKLGLNSIGYITDMEKSRKKPSRNVLIKIAVYFGVSVDSLIRDDMEIEAADWGDDAMDN